MVININGKDCELKFTYNSFRYMGDFSLTDIQNIGETPFKLIGIMETLLFSALNHDPKTVFTMATVREFLENAMDNGTLVEFSEQLLPLLTESSFFRKLQGEAE